MTIEWKVLGLVLSVLSLGVSIFFHNAAHKAYHLDRAFAEADEMIPPLPVRLARWAFRSFRWLRKLMWLWVCTSVAALLFFLLISFVIPI